MGIVRPRTEVLFFKDNCAYRIGKLVEIILDEKITPSRQPYVLPYNIIDKLQTLTINGEPIITDIKYYSSRHNKMKDAYDHLPRKLKEVLHQLVRNKITFDSDKYTSLSENEKIQLLDTYIDYSMYLVANDKGNESNKELKNKVLMKRAEFPISKNGSEKKLKKTFKPHKSHRYFSYQYCVLMIR